MYWSLVYEGEEVSLLQHGSEDIWDNMIDIKNIKFNYLNFNDQDPQAFAILWELKP